MEQQAQLQRDLAKVHEISKATNQQNMSINQLQIDPSPTPTESSIPMEPLPRRERGPLLTNGPLITRVPVLRCRHAAAHSNLARAAVSLAKLDADAVGDTGTDSLRPA